ncbi:MAG: DUF554 domain-containing protein [Acholeplasmatales bacterium]|nr:MAG: DUF554 domain-containing protein [Acholeplasmatales bacterium]
MGTIVNVMAVIVGTLIGIIFKRGLSDKIQKALMFALGIGLFAVATGWFIQGFLTVQDGVLASRHDLLIILSLVIGTLLGEWLDIDGRLHTLAQRVEKKYHLPPLAKGFVAGTLIFCVGAMAILGPIQDGLGQGMTILLVKSALDFVTAMMLAVVFGIGVALAAFSVLIYQGGIHLLATQADAFLSTDMIETLSMVGYVLLIAIGIKFMELKDVKVANMLPSLLVPLLYFFLMGLF